MTFVFYKSVIVLLATLNLLSAWNQLNVVYTRNGDTWERCEKDLPARVRLNSQQTGYISSSNGSSSKNKNALVSDVSRSDDLVE